MQIKKPPLGLMPRWLHNKRRKREIVEAMLRYIDAGVAIPNEWIQELQDLNGGPHDQERESR